MDREVSWQVIEDQRRAIADLLEALTARGWRPRLGDSSLWRVAGQIAADVSLVALPPSPGTLIVDLIRARSSLHTS